MTAAFLRTPAPLRAALSHRLMRRLWRWLLLIIGGLLIGVGAVGALLPGHLGVPILVVGLILVLRTSMQARRQFVGLQRRHPNIVFPIRRLLRREPEVIPVVWQQLLRFERLVIPRRWRAAARLRRRHLRPRRTPRAESLVTPDGAP
ncbi:MAG: hypothetical protein ACHP84_12120 [Caulobacterales bacterium]